MQPPPPMAGSLTVMSLLPSSHTPLAAECDPQPPLSTCRICVAAAGHRAVNLQADVWRQQRTGSLLGLLLASHMARCLHPESCLQLPSARSDCRGLSCFWMKRSFDSPWTGRNLHPQFLLLEPTVRTTGREGPVFPCAHLFRC